MQDSIINEEEQGATLKNQTQQSAKNQYQQKDFKFGEFKSPD